MSERFLAARQRLKPLAARLGLANSAPLWQPIALAAYRRKRADDAQYREWLATRGGAWIREHWGHYAVDDEFTREHLSSQLFELTEQLRRRLGDVGDATVLDAGASDGMFLSLLGVKNGIGVNFLTACAEKIHRDGHRAVAADIERLPFGDKSVDYVICCETLEHVPNPIHTLNELARVCRRTILVSIPWLERTRLNARPAGWPHEESHIFEFSPADFRKIATHANVRVAFGGVVPVFPTPKNPMTRWWMRLWMFDWYFPALQYYELEPLN